ncbi:hypothetical protein F5ESL0233_00090 [Lactobacillus sp. ESL0233]|uniref:hypothetical protein n=1 Tax=Lactobacillus sp. ESL0233 TaxID=2069354 RepID=UPI000EFCBC69|nr:hypothetical protein [Lactobacillus sp. ESL0233]RMC43300.1 hypothetical protein F5ESL0233_00090 [Lactobacillus sp. ESL0233]
MMDNLKPDTIMFLLKFIQNNPRYINDFKTGNLYFTPLRQFIDLEKSQNNCKTGDKYEGTIHENINNLKNLTIAGYKVNIHDVLNMSLDATIPDYMLDNYGICSFFAVRFKNIEKTDDGFNTYKINGRTLNDLKMTEDGNRILFGVNNVRGLFKESVNHKIKGGPVQYYDPNDINAYQIDDNAKMFYKLKRYEFQHEFRLIKDISDGNKLLHFNSIENFGFDATDIVFNG